MTATNGHPTGPMLPDEIETLELLAASSKARIVVFVDDAAPPEKLIAALKVYGGRCVAIHSKSRDQLAALHGPVDLLYLGASVEAEPVLRQLRPLLQPGSIVVAIDAVRQPAYWAAVTTTKEFETTVAGEAGRLVVSLLRS